MIPVEQTQTGFPNGNCFASCVASILELPLDAVPHHLDKGWYRKWQEWLKPHNLTFINFTVDPTGLSKPQGYSILAADSRRGDWLHAVACLDGEIVWDLHPQREMGVGEWREWTVFTVLDASKNIGGKLCQQQLGNSAKQN